MLHALIEETVAVARAEGVQLPAEFVRDRFAMCDQLPAAMTSSMHQDLERGQRLELPWLSGDVVARGQRLGVATPRHREAVSRLQPFVAGGSSA
jgi:2-dehydropantoate 2-reductase